MKCCRCWETLLNWYHSWNIKMICWKKKYYKMLRKLLKHNELLPQIECIGCSISLWFLEKCKKVKKDINIIIIVIERSHIIYWLFLCISSIMSQNHLLKKLFQITLFSLNFFHYKLFNWVNTCWYIFLFIETRTLAFIKNILIM